MTHRRRARGITWIEFAVALLVIAMVATLLLGALRQAEKQAERRVYELTVANVRSGLRLATADLMMRDRLRDLPGLAGSNPVSLLQKPPEGYVGERNDGAGVAPGQWYFDRRSRQLVYRFRDEGMPREGRLALHTRAPRPGDAPSIVWPYVLSDIK